MASCSVYLCDYCLVLSGCISSYCIRLTSICLALRSGSSLSAQTIPNHTITKVARPCWNPHENMGPSSYTELILWAGGKGNTLNQFNTCRSDFSFEREKQMWLHRSVLQTWLHGFTWLNPHSIFEIQSFLVAKVKFFVCLIFDLDFCLGA